MSTRLVPFMKEPTKAINIVPSINSLSISIIDYAIANVEAIPNLQAGGSKYATTSAQTLVTAPKYITSNITLGALSQTNLSAENIIKDTTITINNGQSDLWSVTGTADYIKTVSSIPSTKDTGIVFNSTDNKYYLWED